MNIVKLKMKKDKFLEVKIEQISHFEWLYILQLDAYTTKCIPSGIVSFIQIAMFIKCMWELITIYAIYTK